MNFEKFVNKINETPTRILRREFDNMLRYKSEYKNLDQGNKDVIFDLVLKYKDKLYKHQRIDSTDIRLEMNKLRRNMTKLDMTLEDLKDTEKILKEFRTN